MMSVNIQNQYGFFQFFDGYCYIVEVTETQRCCTHGSAVYARVMTWRSHERKTVFLGGQ